MASQSGDSSEQHKKHETASKTELEDSSDEDHKATPAKVDFVSPAFPTPTENEFEQFLRCRAHHKVMKARIDCNKAVSTANAEFAAALGTGNDLLDGWSAEAHLKMNAKPTPEEPTLPDPLPDAPTPHAPRASTESGEHRPTLSEQFVSEKQTETQIEKWVWPTGGTQFTIPPPHV